MQDYRILLTLQTSASLITNVYSQASFVSDPITLREQWNTRCIVTQWNNSRNGYDNRFGYLFLYFLLNLLHISTYDETEDSSVYIDSYIIHIQLFAYVINSQEHDFVFCALIQMKRCLFKKHNYTVHDYH